MNKYLLLMFLLIPFTVKSQFYLTGEISPFKELRQIKAEKFTLVYDIAFEGKAHELASIIDSSFTILEEANEAELKPITILVLNDDVNANGYVATAPRRMVLISTPPADNISHDWLKHLALHETMHVVQLDQLKRGFTNILRFIIGDGGTALSAAFLTFWYLEGDAVIAETRFSPAGRGREADFYRSLRTNLLEREKYFSYSKAYFGSYKDIVPNHYQLGYHITSYAFDKYGEGFWPHVVKYSGRNTYQLFPLFFGIKKLGNQSLNSLYCESMEYYRDKYEISYDYPKNYSEPSQINKNAKGKNEITQYQHANFLNDSIIVCEKTGFDKIARFIKINVHTGEEFVLHQPGLVNYKRLSLAENLLVWTEIIPHHRYNTISHSVIKKLDINTGKVTQLSRKSRYFAPALSHDGRKVVAVHVSLDNQFSLDILDAQTGQILTGGQFLTEGQIQFPVFSESGKEIYFTLLSDSGKAIYSYSLESGLKRKLFDAGFANLADLRTHGPYILFHGDFEGIGNIYALHIEENKLYRLSWSKYGAQYPAMSRNGHLVYSDYSLKGFKLVGNYEWQRFKVEYDFNNNTQPAIADSIFNTNITLCNHTNPTGYASSEYKRWKHLINIHSWLPFYMDLNHPEEALQTLRPGIQLFTQNLTENLYGQVGYRYDESDHIFFSALTFTGLGPVIRYGVSYGQRYPIIPENAPPLRNQNPPIRHSLNISYPVNLTNGKYYFFIVPAMQLEYENFYVYAQSISNYRNISTTADANLNIQHNLKRAYRDIYPKFGQGMYINYRFMPANVGFLGSWFRIFPYTYWPGFSENHGIRLSGQLQWQIPEKENLLPYGFRMPRGYGNSIAKEAFGINLDYSFPMLYPDLALHRLAYVKRIRANIFGDFTYGLFPERIDDRIVNNYRNLSSVGADLIADFHMAQMFFPLSAGIRAGYLIDNKSWFTSLIFQTNFGNF